MKGPWPDLNHPNALLGWLFPEDQLSHWSTSACIIYCHGKTSKWGTKAFIFYLLNYKWDHIYGCKTQFFQTPFRWIWCHPFLLVTFTVLHTIDWWLWLLTTLMFHFNHLHCFLRAYIVARLENHLRARKTSCVYSEVWFQCDVIHHVISI